MSDFFRASWQICVDFLNIFSLDECLERRSLRYSVICRKIDGFRDICDFVVGSAKRSVCSVSKIEGEVEIADDLWVTLYSYVYVVIFN